MKVNERTNMLKTESKKNIEECQKMEEKIFEQQEEVEMLRRRWDEIESELTRSRDGKENEKEI